uniref:Cytochrome c oxidase assembly factor 7 n=1 Tax=Romanomermis culicivorax TaxID=13658 RepID=A0A915KMI5_ROMCU
MTLNFKREEEVKDYLANLLLEYKFSCLSEKNQEGCDLLGTYYEQILKDLPRAMQVWERNCDERNFPTSCRKFANYLMRGSGGYKKDRARALTLFSKACQKDDAKSCYYKGCLAYLGTKNQPKDINIFLASLAKACDLNDENSCHILHKSYYLGVEIPCNAEKAYKYATIMCDKYHDFEACGNVADFLIKGYGVEKDEKKSDAYRAKAEDLFKDLKNNQSTDYTG